MGSTSDACRFERSSGPAPRFFFSLSSSSADLSKDKIGEADVFAIFGKGGYCGNGVVPAVTSTPKPVLTSCTYKNQSYSQGAKWTDGCNLDCSCVDASIGRYICTDKCPTYPSLSSQCQLKNVSGGCCLEPVCGGFVSRKAATIKVRHIVKEHSGQMDVTLTV